MIIRPATVPDLCINVNEGFLAGEGIFVRDVANEWTLRWNVRLWTFHELAGKVDVIKYLAPVSDEYLPLFEDGTKFWWHAIRFENERDMVTFKMFWL